MSLRLFLLERHVPAAMRRHMLRRLVRATADAFGVPPPPMTAFGDERFVEAYAAFTRSEAENVAGDQRAAAATRSRLYTGARALGVSIRVWAGVRTPAEAVRALRLIYAAIGIDLDTDLAARSVTVRRCAFSQTYTPTVCQFVSALDAGLFHGVSGAWSVSFTERITDGASACRGRLTEAWDQ